MSFKFDDRVTWVSGDDGGRSGDEHGIVDDVNHALGKVHVRWDTGEYGWVYYEDLELVDVVTRLAGIDTANCQADTSALTDDGEQQ